MRGTRGWLLLLAAIIAAFFWKILFTSQYSMIIGWEGVNQAYAWYNYSARTVQQGILPAWDPYTLAGHTFVGETQTGLFYPLKLLLYLWPLDRTGLLSERIFHDAYVLAHLLGGIFMYLCARELGIRNGFPAFVSAMCFTLGGFVGKMGWVHQIDSAIWLPLVLLFALRSLRSDRALVRSANACCAGLALGVSLLAGSVHVPLMSVLVIISASCLYAFRPDGINSSPAPLRSRLNSSASVVLLIGIISFAASAVQLLPSMEYAPVATRWIFDWAGPFYQKIPYFAAGGLVRMSPRSLFAFVFGMVEAGGAEFGPYFGVMPLLLAVLGAWRNWAQPWVKYLAILAAAAFLYGMGDYTLFHGIGYLLIPYIDKLWEAGRFIYLTHFAMALLAGFGVQTLFAADAASEACFSRLNSILKWTVIIVTVVLGIPAVLGTPQVGDWPYVTLTFLIATWAVFFCATHGHRGLWTRIALVAVIVCDLYVFTFTFQNKMVQRKANEDRMEEMRSLQPVADFLKAQPGLFRSNPTADFSPRNMGDVFGFQTTAGYGATMLTDYLPALFSPMANCLFNIRYILGSGKGDPEQPPVFTSGKWKVFETSNSCPRAWMVHRTAVDSPANVQKQVQDGGFDPREVAYLSEAPQSPLDPSPATPAAITFGNYLPDQFSLDADVSATGLLVLSEVYYPGWVATINGQPAHIYKVDNILRGLVVSPGSNHIVMQYRPMSIHFGAILSALAFLFTFAFAAFVFWRRHPESEPRP